jgi:hypothetical protein
MAFCNLCKSNITTSANPVDLDVHKKYKILNHFSEPTDKIVLMVYHEYPDCVQFNPNCVLQWWSVLGKLLLNLRSA